ncbi:naphthalene 1,2-dioxygenase/salicylate 5-hydroxylase systems, ferredoxin component [bacterium BMS3Bbin04]|nr:naphthalene 1,2-dioxygenase/salicylate 5-hydroxylase systems, ferredoxin component [bacterium BMS3Bbin04]
MATEFIDVLPVDELNVNAVKIVDAGGKRILLANDEGDIRAVSAYCTHDGGDLDGEELDDHEVCCHRHGARFDLRSGEATRMPAVFGLVTFETKVEDGRIFVAV